MKCIADVRNTPEMAAQYIVARFDDHTNALWYWGSFGTREKADEIAAEIGGMVLRRGWTAADVLDEIMNYTYGMLTPEKEGLQHKILSMKGELNEREG